MTACTTVRRVGGLALLLVLSIAASAQAAVPAAPVLQLRVTDGRTCTGTLVSARFVLTAAHCISGHDASLPRLQIYSRARAKQFAKVAAVSYPPKAAGRRPDVALLQLTSPSSRRPARLPDRRLTPRRGTAAKVSGWTTKRTRGRHARLASLRSCGPRPPRGALCGRLRGAVPSVRCRDAAGAALTVRRNGTTVLLGIGGRSPRGCRKPPRVRFANVSGANLRAWIAGTIDPGAGSGEPGGGGEPGGPGGVIPDSYVGSWAGEISEDLPDQKTYGARLTIDRDGEVGETVGRTDYASGLCGGTLVLQGKSADGSITVVEHLTSGRDVCADGGTITLAHVVERPAISYSWTGAAAEGRASGVLARLP